MTVAHSISSRRFNNKPCSEVVGYFAQTNEVIKPE